MTLNIKYSNKEEILEQIFSLNSRGWCCREYSVWGSQINAFKRKDFLSCNLSLKYPEKSKSSAGIFLTELSIPTRHSSNNMNKRCPFQNISVNYSPFIFDIKRKIVELILNLKDWSWNHLVWLVREINIYLFGLSTIPPKISCQCVISRGYFLR